jgi:beta-phosphoglucomutase
MTAFVDAAILDLDGVITGTSARHIQSWKEAAREFGIETTEETLWRTRSVSREQSLAVLLQAASTARSSAEQRAIMEYKNNRYLELISNLGPTDAYPGAREALLDCKKRGLGVAIASASLNAKLVLDRLDLSRFVDVVVDPRRCSAPKPSPQIFEVACQQLAVTRERAICLDDSPAMVAALVDINMYVVAVGESDRFASVDPDEIIPAIAAWDVERSVRMNLAQERR